MPPMIEQGMTSALECGTGRDTGFSVGTKMVVLIIVAVTLSYLSNTWFSAVLVGPLLAYVALGGKAALARKLLVSYALLFVLYGAMSLFDLRIAILSPVHIFMAWKAFPAVIAVVALVTTPPGLISSFLASFHVPKKLIVGMLVIFRFFPTMASGMRRLGDSLKNRGLLSFRQVVGNPLDTLEYLLVPLMMTLINSADQLASSAVTRAAEAPTKRTSYYQRTLRASDCLCVASFAILAAVTLWMSSGGMTGGLAG